MTTRREVPITGDTLAWVHNELAEIRSKLALAQQAADQGRTLATEASDRSLQARNKVELFDGHGAAIEHLQDDLRAAREMLTRVQDDIHSLRQSREEVERRAQADSDRIRQDRNEAAHRFSELERLIEGLHDRTGSYEEQARRNLEQLSILAQRMEAVAAQETDLDTMVSRSQSAMSRMDAELQRLSASLNERARDDDAQRERLSSTVEAIRRQEAEIEALKTTSQQLSRLDDRLELVQAERTRHNERLNDLTVEQTRAQEKLNEFGERVALVEVRIGGYQEELKSLRGLILEDHERITAYLHGITELEADLRKRQIIALEKEIRDIRGRAINFPEE